MYISKLKIFGFKSFAHKIEINFPGSGLTSIVGPNGCGKSNIVDAIRWVMGEQRAKQLRSSKMEDVIFAGTKDRQRLNLAEVSLVIDNSLGLLNSEFSEIQITRRAYRDKGSEYLINNEKCTLSAINSLFYDTGMGASSYSLMEQGVIDAILKNPEERRNVLEEAAGINKYKQERKKALRQLERTEIDLERVEERIRAFQKNLRRFEKQAEKASEYRRLQSEYKKLDISVSYDKYVDFKDNFLRFEEQWQKQTHQKDSLNTRLDEVETILQEKKLAMSNEEETYREFERLVVAQNMHINDLNNKFQRNNDRKLHISEQLLHWQEDIENAKSDIAQLNEKNAELVEEQNDLQELLSSVEENLNNLNEQKTVIRERYEEAREDVRDLDVKRTQLTNDYLRIRDDFNRENQNLLLSEDRKESLLNQKNELQEELQLFQQKLSEIESQSVDYNFDLLNEKIETQLNQIENYQEQISDLNKSEREFDGHKIALASRKEMLERMIANNEGLGSGTKAVLEHKKDSVKGVLADYINVEDKYLESIETALGAAMQAVLLDVGADSDKIFNYLEEQSQGNALLALPNIDFSKDFRPEISNSSFIGWASDFVSVNEDSMQFHGVVKALLSSYALVDSYESALELAKQNVGRNLYFISPDKRVVSTSGIIRGGGKNSGKSGILNRAAELEKIDESIDELLLKIESIQSEKSDLQERLDETKVLFQDAKEELELKRQQIQSFDSQKQLELANIQSREQRLARINTDLEELEKKISNMRKQTNSDNSDVIAEAESLKNETEAVYQQKSVYLSELQIQVEDISEQVMQAQRAVSTDQQRQAQISQQLENLLQRNESLYSLIESRQQQIDNVKSDDTNTDDAMVDLKNEIELENEKLDQISQQRDEAKEVFDAKSSALEDYRNEISELNRQIRDITEEAHEIEMKMQTQSSNAKNIKDGVWGRWEISLDDEASDLPLIEYDLDSANNIIKDLKKSIKDLGNVNLEAIDDFEEEKLLMEEDEKQFNDLDRARISLKNTITNLDKIAKDRFEETFELIKVHFQDVFSSITNGGEAHLHLVKSEEDSDPLSDKVMVNAALPGKTLKGIDALSGGEKALTAVALLFSLYLVKPSPYCILDEVDAPLDDANVNRFVELIRRFSRNTQFIIVTHNKHTMSGSDRLYGVTQENKGISNIASVQLEEAIDIVN